MKEGCALTIVCLNVEAGHLARFFVLYSGYDALHQTDPILYQVGDGADKSDRPFLYCRAGKSRVGPAGIRSSFFGDAASAGEFPGAAAAFSTEYGVAGIGAPAYLFAGGSFVRSGFADLRPGG